MAKVLNKSILLRYADEYIEIKSSINKQQFFFSFISLPENSADFKLIED
jgi:hypothetical protein